MKNEEWGKFAEQTTERNSANCHIKIQPTVTSKFSQLWMPGGQMVIHAGHSLLVIADLLSTTELNDENIGYWLNNTNLIRLNYLEF